jgi:hypothetical protein
MIAVRNLEKSIKSSAGNVSAAPHQSRRKPGSSSRSWNLRVREVDAAAVLGMRHRLAEYELQGQPAHTLRQKDRLALKKHVGFVSKAITCSTTSPCMKISRCHSVRDMPRAQRQSIVAGVLDRSVVGEGSVPGCRAVSSSSSVSLVPSSPALG